MYKKHTCMTIWNSKFGFHMLIQKRCALIGWWVSLPWAWMQILTHVWFGVLSTLLNKVDLGKGQHWHAWKIHLLLQVLVTFYELQKTSENYHPSTWQGIKQNLHILILETRKNLHAIYLLFFGEDLDEDITQLHGDFSFWERVPWALIGNKGSKV